LHDIGLRVVADRYEMDGWHAILLGANTPAPDVVRAVWDHRAELVAVSAHLGLHVRATARLVAAVREGAPGTRVVVGGHPFTLVPDLWRVVGADAS